MSLLQESDCLRKVPLFKALEPAKLKLLAFTSEMMVFQPGETVFKAGESGDCAYVLTEGEIEILSSTDASAVVGVLQRNQIFGELALINDEPRGATLRARGEVTVMKISESMFMQLIHENSELALNVVRQLSQKLAASHRHVEELQNQIQSASSGS